MKKVKLGLIGCGGRAGEHMKTFVQMDTVQVIAVADPIEERRNAAAQIFGCDCICRDHTELYDRKGEELDAVVICVEPTAHADIELRAIALGVPFLVEKPMTVDLALAERIEAGVREKNLLTLVGFQDRYQDLTAIIKDELPKHKPGGLVYGSWVMGIPGVWWWQRKSDCGGQLVEQNIHLLDELRYLFGEPLSVYATASRGIVEPGKNGVSPAYDTDDHSTAVLRFENSFTATLVSGCYTTARRPRCGLYITMEDIIFDYRLRNNLIIETAAETRDIPRRADHTAALDRAFIEALLTGDRSLIRSDYSDALKSLKLAFAANRSMETGEVIYFDR